MRRVHALVAEILRVSPGRPGETEHDDRERRSRPLALQRAVGYGISEYFHQLDADADAEPVVPIE